MFTKLETKDMEEICNGIYKKLNKMSKELKVRINKDVHNTTVILKSGTFINKIVRFLSLPSTRNIVAWRSGKSH